ncbi:hypothetical protein [Kribbella sp. VKM Ac-2569]|uniref:hypothetical protein n=1 Tax=Kribbella sp. VKM Ac-2569 TaxID=2512220 RepID=UPI00102CAFCD|nr:hypothetical protein [Kribbella sp. VKM Ac-2569]
MADRFDLDAIEADDALLDLLATGGESARAAGEHDPAVQLLADLRLAVEVEDELPVETIDDPESFLARCAALNPITDPFARKMATRGLAFGVAAVAALSVSGVAAAVTGDPLSPYEKVIEKMVDAVRPQTSFPKEDLDGLPVVDRSKIVKVGKDFKEKAKAEHAAENAGKTGVAGDGELSQDGTEKPEALGLPADDKPLAIREKDALPVKPEPTQDPVKPTTEVTPTPTDTKTTEPTDTKTTEPTDTTTTETPPDTPTTTPTDEPTDTTTPTPTPTPTETTTTTPPTNVDTGTGDSNTSTGDSTATPSAGSGEGQTSDGDTTPGSDTTTPAGDTGGTGGSDTSGTDTSGSGETPGSDVTQIPAEVKELVETIVAPVLPTPSGEPVANETTERFFGTPDATAQSVTTSKAKKAAGKHASGKVSTGSVRKVYPKGKHSSGTYAEGKHAAIARTYGSTTDASLLQILDVVNAPIK